MVEAAADKKVFVNTVEVKGVKRTRPRLVIGELKPILGAATVGEFFTLLGEAQERLSGYQIFDGVEMTVDESDALPGALDVRVVCQEGRKLKMTISAQAGTNEGVIHVGGRLRNLLGLADVLQVESNTGYSHQSQYSASYMIPFSHRTSISNFTAALYQNSADQLASSHREVIRGTSMFLKLPISSARYSLGAVCDWREICGVHSGMPFSVRLEAGHSLKTSLLHTLEIDTRDSVAIPRRGHLLRLSQEVAGFGGDVRFIKQNVQAQCNFSLPWNASVSASLQGGVLLPGLFKASQRTYISDRFFLGGPLSVRGYHMRGIGPRHESASLGGEMYAAGGLHLFTRLPLWGLFGDKVLLHGFVTGGSLSNLPTDMGHIRQLLANQFAWSYGAGLAINFGIGRLEINYCVPQPGRNSYSFIKGVQVGLGIEFL